MPHHTPLIALIVAGLFLAFVMGALAHRLRISPLAGYLLAGVLVGPFTPGYVGDAALANELAELGVILLMFGVGLHFSLKDLMAVKNVAIPGAIGQIAVATLMGVGLSRVLGWDLLASLVFGLALSVASTVVLLRALQSRNLVDTHRGRIAVGWLIVEDLVMVLALVLLPALADVMKDGDAAGAGFTALLLPLGITLLKITGFVALMLLVGRRVIPGTLHWVVHTGSRELFRLAVLAIALGVAFGAAFVFGVSFALGAFFAGMILGESSLSRRAAEETLPLRDAFAVLFFVSVGMLFDPRVLIEQPVALIATVAIIIVGKSIAAYAIVRLFRHTHRTALTVAASLAQIGEFSFILATLGTSLAILPSEARDLILASAILSILINPLLFRLLLPRPQEASAPRDEADGEPEPAPGGHVILVGYGRVGHGIAGRLAARGSAVVVIDDQTDIVARAKADGHRAICGTALDVAVLRSAGIETATALLIAIPEGFEGGGVGKRARAIAPDLPIVARAHSTDEVAYIRSVGVEQVVLGEQEIADRMVVLCCAPPDAEAA